MIQLAIAYGINLTFDMLLYKIWKSLSNSFLLLNQTMARNVWEKSDHILVQHWQGKRAKSIPVLSSNFG